MRQQFLVDIADTFKTYIYEDNRKAVPSSATFTVYKPGTDTKLIDSQAMTVGSDGLLSYALTATHNDVADENYKAVIAYVLSSTTYYATLFYDIVNSKLVSVVTDEDIINELPQLKDYGWRVHGTADSGSTTTIVDAELKRYADDYFTGGLAHSLTKDEIREIADFSSSTGTVTVAAAFNSAISADKYLMTRSFTKEIQRAFEKIDDYLRRKGRRSHLILDPYDLREPHLLWAVAEVCKGLVSIGPGGTLWWEFMERYDKRGYTTLESMSFKYDESEDGYISGAEESKRLNRTLGRS